MLSAWLASGERPAETSAAVSETEKRGRTSQSDREAAKQKDFSKTKADLWLDSPEFCDQCLEVRSTCVFCAGPVPGDCSPKRRNCAQIESACPKRGNNWTRHKFGFSSSSWSEILQ